MRATISFEADIDKVNNIMRSLILEETHALEEALNCMEGATSDRLVDGINESLGHIYGVVRQLEQYRDMVVSFERARFETILPQPAMTTVPTPPTGKEVGSVSELREAIESMKDFDSFLGGIGPAEGDRDGTEEG